MIKNEFWGIDRTEEALTIEKKVLTSWRGICYFIVVMQNNIPGRIKMIEDGIMDKTWSRFSRNGTEVEKVALNQRHMSRQKNERIVNFTK